MRQEQLSREDLREVTQVQDLGAMEILMGILVERSAQQLVYSNLAQEIGVAVDTMKRWIDLLGRLHYGFLVRPWFVDVAKALGVAVKRVSLKVFGPEERLIPRAVIPSCGHWKLRRSQISFRPPNCLWVPLGGWPPTPS